MINKIIAIGKTPLRLSVFLLFGFHAPNCYSQKQLKMEALNRYQLLKGDTLHQFYAVKPGKKIKYDNSKHYYWYLQDTIIITQAANDGKILHGTYNIYYPDKNLKEKGEFKNGLRSGEWKYWYPGGKLKQIIIWDKGEMDGKIEEYDEQGNETRRGTYNNDLFTGYTIERSTDGKDVKIFYKKGKKTEEGSSKQ